VSATHTWNDAATANGAPADNKGQVVPTSAVLKGDGSTTLTFVITGATGNRGNDAPLAGLEGGKLTLTVQSDSATPSGTTRINVACGTAGQPAIPSRVATSIRSPSFVLTLSF